MAERASPSRQRPDGIRRVFSGDPGNFRPRTRGQKSAGVRGADARRAHAGGDMPPGGRGARARSRATTTAHDRAVLIAVRALARAVDSLCLRESIPRTRAGQDPDSGGAAASPARQGTGTQGSNINSGNPGPSAPASRPSATQKRRERRARALARARAQGQTLDSPRGPGQGPGAGPIPPRGHARPGPGPPGPGHGPGDADGLLPVGTRDLVERVLTPALRKHTPVRAGGGLDRQVASGLPRRQEDPGSPGTTGPARSPGGTAPCAPSVETTSGALSASGTFPGAVSGPSGLHAAAAPFSPPARAPPGGAGVGVAQARAGPEGAHTAKRSSPRGAPSGGEEGGAELLRSPPPKRAALATTFDVGPRGRGVHLGPEGRSQSTSLAVAALAPSGDLEMGEAKEGVFERGGPVSAARAPL